MSCDAGADTVHAPDPDVIQPSVMRHSVALLLTLAAGGCVGRAAPAPSPAALATNGPRALSVYRTIAESVYVRTTNRVVAVAATTLDTTCSAATCAPLAARWGMETVWWGSDHTEGAIDARNDLLARAGEVVTIGAAASGRPLLFEADPGDMPPIGAGTAEWNRFRATHADASGIVRMSPVGFSRSGRTAVAFVDWRCGPTCGHRLGVVLAAASDTSWMITDMLLVSSDQRQR
jgi:hypothetical protein